MKFRAYGHVKESKTAEAITGAIIKIYLNEEELQKVKSDENGFYELIVNIEDSRIDSGQQLRLTFEKGSYKIQEHYVLATEGSFNMDVKFKTETKEKKAFNWLPVIIAGGAVIILLIVSLIVLLSVLPKAPKIISFFVNPTSIEASQSTVLSWETEKATSVEMLIDQNLVPVELSGSKHIQPIQTTEYILIAKNEKGEARASQSVEVKDIVRIDSLVPIGGINPFYGDPATLPDNWKVCDGSTVDDEESPLYGKALPDLREKFIRGEAESSLNILDNLGEGGTDDHDHNITIKGDGNHSHRGSVSISGTTNSFGAGVWACCPSSQHKATASHTHSFSGAGSFTTNGASHSHTATSYTKSHLPSYIALHYIIRIK